MLVLSRRPQQSFVIGHDIVITVLEVNGDNVRIGIKAPRDVDIHREEVYLELQQANQSAASPSAGALAAFTRRASKSPGEGNTSGTPLRGKGFQMAERYDLRPVRRPAQQGELLEIASRWGSQVRS